MALIGRYIYTLSHNPNIYAIYSGDENGDFLEVINMKSSKQLYRHFTAAVKTRWLIIKVTRRDAERKKIFYNLDDALSQLRQSEESSDYMANLRSWYQQAIGTDRAVRSNPYTFSNLQEKGITYSKWVGITSTVLALDFTLSKLNILLKSLKFSDSSKIVLFTSEGETIASSEDSFLKSDKEANLQLIDNQQEQVFLKEEGGRERYTMVTTLNSENGTATYLSISVDQNEMLY